MLRWIIWTRLIVALNAPSDLWNGPTSRIVAEWVTNESNDHRGIRGFLMRLTFRHNIGCVRLWLVRWKPSELRVKPPSWYKAGLNIWRPRTKYSFDLVLLIEYFDFVGTLRYTFTCNVIAPERKALVGAFLFLIGILRTCLLMYVLSLLDFLVHAESKFHRRINFSRFMILVLIWVYAT